jgi:alkylation response protein AidB-like acyl-CoA dehydrogenase
MDFRFTEQENELIKNVRAFIRQESTPELLEETRELSGIYGGIEGRKFIRKFAANGWLTPNWPKV